jgi:secreted trypsin-like serine protease
VGFGLNGNANRVNVVKVVADSRFDTNRLGNGFDTAVLTLAAPVAAAVATPIPFNHDAAVLKNGAQVRIVGFGRNVQAPSNDNSSNFGFGTKRELSVKLNQVQQRLLSIGATGGQKCFGDSGGPTFLNLAGKGDVVIGVTSFGNGDCSNGGFDSRVDAYLDFLDKEIPLNEQQPAPTPPGNGADVTPPSVRIVSPADQSTLKSGTVQLVAEASDDVGLKDVVLTWAIPNQGRVFKVSCAKPVAGFTCTKDGATHTFSFAVGTGLRAFNFAAEDTSGNRTVTDENDLFFTR